MPRSTKASREIEQLTEELTQTRTSLESTVIKLNETEKARAELRRENAELRLDQSRKTTEIGTLTQRVLDLDRDLQREKNMRQSAESSRDLERKLVIERTDECLEERRLRRVAEENVILAKSEIADLKKDKEALLRNQEEHLRTIERLDRYVSLAASRGRAS